MKKSLFLVLMMCCSLFCFTSCSSDDENNTPSAGNVVGTYNGPLGVTVDGTSTGDAVNYPIVITATDDNTITLSIANFSLSALGNLGNFQIKGCSCTYANGVYTLSGTTSVSIKLGLVSLPCPVAISGNITSDKATLNIIITVPGTTTQKVVVTYVGTKKS
jgi:hypothetical protein